jgi:hypothetical protein
MRAPPAARRLGKPVAREDHRHAETVGNSHDAQAHADTYHGRADADAHTDSHPDPDADAHIDSDADADAHHGDTHADSDHGDINASLRHGDTNGDGQRHGGQRPRSGDRLDGSDHRAGQPVRRGRAVAAEP